MMFPFDIDDEELNINIEEKSIPSDYEIDFDTGRLTGKIITGIEALKQWIKIVLLTDRYIFNQYSWDHGSDLYTLIGQTYSKDYIDTEVKRMIKEALSVNEDITGFDNLEIKMNDDRLSISFNINTIYGRGEVNV